MAKSLHPDVNPDLTAEQYEIWLMIQDAYQRGDLERLKAMEVIFEAQLIHLDNALMTKDQLELRIATLKEGILALEKDIQILNSQFPFSIARDINNAEWMAAEQEKLTGRNRQPAKQGTPPASGIQPTNAWLLTAK